MSSFTVESNVINGGGDISLSYHSYVTAQENGEPKDVHRLLHIAQLQKELHAAIRADNLSLVKEILDTVEDASSPDIKKNTALHTAASNGRPALIVLLLTRSEVHINARNQCGATALHFASFMGHAEVVRILLAYTDIDVNAQALNGGTALMLAAQGGYTSIVQMLLEKPGIGVNLKWNKLGDTALTLAVRKERVVVVRMLVEHPDTDIHVLNNQSYTPYVLANIIGNSEIKGILRSRGSIFTFLYERFVLSLYAPGPRVTYHEFINNYWDIYSDLVHHAIGSSSIGMD